MWESCPCIIHLFSSFPFAPLMSFSVNIISTVLACMEMLFCITFWEVHSLRNPNLYRGLVALHVHVVWILSVFQGQLEMLISASAF